MYGMKKTRTSLHQAQPASAVVRCGAACFDPTPSQSSQPASAAVAFLLRWWGGAAFNAITFKVQAFDRCVIGVQHSA